MESDNWYITDIHKANKRIKKLEAENERLKKLAIQLASESFNKGAISALEYAAEIAEQIEFNLSRYNTGSKVAQAIRAEIKDD